MSDRILTIIEARKGSTRLPSKVLLELEGKTVLEHVIHRIGKCRGVSETIVATTIAREDLAITKLCAQLGIRVYCGSQDDPLERYYQAARLYGGEHIIRIKADCPLIDPCIVDAAIHEHLETGADYTSNTIQRTYPVGEDVEILTRPALERLWSVASLPSEREHITLYIARHPEQFWIHHLVHRLDLSAKRWTLDNPEDYEFLKVLFRHLHPLDPDFGMDMTLEFLASHPDLEWLNAHIPVDAGIRKSLRRDPSG